jgi:hypothetical protein
VKVVVIKGKVQIIPVHGKPYVRIYVYTDYGGEELAKCANMEVEGLVVVKDDCKEGNTR